MHVGRGGVAKKLGAKKKGATGGRRRRKERGRLFDWGKKKGGRGKEKNARAMDKTLAEHKRKKDRPL